MTKTINEIKQALQWNDKAFQIKEAELKSKINELSTELKYLVHSHNYIQKHLEKQLSTNETQKNEPNKSFNLPNPVYASTGKSKEKQTNHKRITEDHQVIDLTGSVPEQVQDKNPFPFIKQRRIRHTQKDRRKCKQCTRTFPDSTSLKIHERTHNNYMKNRKRKVNYSPIRNGHYK